MWASSLRAFARRFHGVKIRRPIQRRMTATLRDSTKAQRTLIPALIGGVGGGLAVMYMTQYNDAAASNDNDSDRWRMVTENCVPAVVSLKVTQTRNFGSASAGNFQATGFVVDKEKGIILTNRHVVADGPVTAIAIFQNQEKVICRPLYRDPVHDFGFFQFDPRHVKHMQLKEIALHPEKAKVGADIRLIGNNAGEKLTISTGSLSRLDRNAPVYGPMTYNDFNTYYMQAASNTTGGSSGSPVLNQQGEAIALNAAGKSGTSIGFYLPLDRVQRAFKLLQQGKPVPRGTIQTTFVAKSFADVTLPPEICARMRAANSEGVLVVKDVVPAGPAHNIIEPGDVLVQMNGQDIGAFVPMEAQIDDNVDKPIKLSVVRNGKLLDLDISRVQDLHSIMASTLLETGGAVMHNLSYHMARTNAIPVKGSGVFIAHSGYAIRRAGIPNGALVLSIFNPRTGEKMPTPDLDALEAALDSFNHGERAVFRVTHVADTNLSILTPINVDKRWFPQARLHRQLKPISVPGGGKLLVEEWSRVETTQDITSGTSSDEGPASTKDSETKCENDSAKDAPSEKQSMENDEKSTENDPKNSNSQNAEKAEAKSPESSTKSSEDPNESGIMRDALFPDSLGFGGFGAPGMSMGGSKQFLSPTQIEQHVGPSLVFVRTAIPYAVDGYHCPNGFVGTGLVVDAEQGLIVVDRNTVPASLVDVTLSFTHHQDNFLRQYQESEEQTDNESHDGLSSTGVDAVTNEPLTSISAEVEYIHPVHNFAVLRCDPKLLQQATKGYGENAPGIKSADLVKGCHLSECAGKNAYLVGIDGNPRRGHKVVSSRGTVQETVMPQLPIMNPPKFRPMNCDLLNIHGAGPIAQHQDGVLTDLSGGILAYWASFHVQVPSPRGTMEEGQIFQGISSDLLLDVLTPLREGVMPTYRALGVEMDYFSITEARDLGLDWASIKRQRRQAKAWPPKAVVVRRRWGDSDAQTKLQDGDVILEIDGEVISNFRDAELLSQNKETVTVKVLRDAKIQTMEVNTVLLDDQETTRVVQWAGTILQVPPSPIAWQHGESRHGVYVAAIAQGSPGSESLLPPTHRIMEVDGCPTTDLEAFLQVVKDKKDGATVRIKHVDLKGIVHISHLRVDTKYWPTYDLNRVCQPLSEFDPNAENYTARCNWMREAVKSSISSKVDPFADK